MELKTIMELRIFKQLKAMQTELDKEPNEPINDDNIVKLTRYLEPFSIDLLQELAYNECYYNDQLGDMRMEDFDDLRLVFVVSNTDDFRATMLMRNKQLKEVVNNIAIKIANDLDVDVEDQFNDFY